MFLNQDIIDHVISQFGRGSLCPQPRDLLNNYKLLWSPQFDPDEPLALETLKNMCLVSHSCRRTAAKYVFHTIQIEGDSWESLRTSLRRAHKLLSASSTSIAPVPTFIKTVSVALIHRIAWGGKSGWGTNPPVEGLFGDGALTEVFEIIGRECAVTTLRITMGYRFTIKWKELPLQFRTSLQTLIRSPCLKILELAGVEDIPSHLFHDSVLESLKLYYVTLDTTNNEVVLASDETFHPPNLNYLITDTMFCGKLTEAPGWKTALTDLKGCNIRTHAMDLELLELAQHSLEVIRHDGGYFIKEPPPDGIFDPFNFGSYPRLQKLSIVHRHSDDPSRSNFIGGGPAGDDIMDIVETLDSGDNCSNLQSLTIVIRQIDGGSGSPQANFLVRPNERNAWKELDRLIASPTFPSLRHLKLVLKAEIQEHVKGTFDTPLMEKLTREGLEETFEKIRALQRVELEFKFQVFSRQILY